MIRKTLILALSSVVSAALSYGAWDVIDDFEGYADQAALEAVWTQVDDPDGEGGGGVLAEDPFAAGNMVLQVNHGAPTTVTGSYNVHLYRAIPEVGPTGTATVYWRFGVPSVLDGEVEVDGVVDTVMGLSPVDDPTRYADYSPLIRQEFDGTMDFYNRNTYTFRPETLPGSTWNQVWFVVDADNRTYDAYIQGGDAYPTQTLVADDFGWRNRTLEALDRFLLTASAGDKVAHLKGRDAILIDDIHMAAGMDLSSPTAGAAPNDPLIGGTPIDGVPGWFLSDWFGAYSTDLAPWLFHADHGWLYQNPGSSNQSTYIYDEAITAWWWTSQTMYPFLYRFSDGVWLWYLEGSSDPRLFYNLSTGTWENL